ncbi:MAG: hypothetical protein OXG03_02835 [Gammaproteobacteria bacterium]|nr:hypothetical protein [Gammaproteobacteria bacterium]
MGKKKKKSKEKITLERIMEQPIAKRLYVSLIPIDNLLGDMRLEIDEGERDEDDSYYVRIQELREGLVRTLDDVLQDCGE